MTVEADRARLIARDPFAIVINEFVEGDSDTLDIVFGRAGLTLDNGIRFVQSAGVTAESMYSRIYTIAKRGHWLKHDVWIQKRGDTVTLFKYDPKVPR